MKKFYFLLMSMLLPMVAMADDSGSCGENVTYTFVEETGTLTISGSGAMTDYNYSVNAPWLAYSSQISYIVIEEGITSVGSHAFSAYNYNGPRLTNVVSVSLPNSLTSIGYSAFYGCTSLVKIAFPNALTTIGASAFCGCSSIISLTIPDGVTSIADNTFNSCSGMMSISLPESLASIGEHAFYGCSGLTELIIPSTVTYIGSGAFESCSNITSIDIPDGVSTINSASFQYCSKLTDIKIPIAVTSIGDYALYGCNLESITIPDGVNTIGKYAFSGCNFTTISIPNSVKNIEDGAFNSCRQLEEVYLPDGLTTIKASSFNGCRNLKTITIPSAVEIIYGEAFANCNELELIIAKPTTPPTTLNTAFSNKDVPVRVPTGCVDAYKAADVWKTFTYLDDQTVHKLRYMVDDQVYKEFDLEYGADIPSVDNPTKEGFVFQGWQYEKNGKTYTFNPNKDDIKMPARDFSFTANFKPVTYSLTYYVDNRYVYSESHAYGDAITPYEYTAPEGYTFSGWADLPETMPANDLKIYGTTQRDPETIDLTMLVKVIDLIMSSSYSKDYDLNNDGDLNIGDVILIVKQILASSSNNTRGTRAGDITDISEFTAAHFILKVPAGADVSEICLTEGNQKTHRVMYEKKDDQTFAVVVFSLENARLTSENGTIVKAVTANGGIITSTIESATFVTPNGEKSIIDPSNGTTAIRTILGIEKTATIYDLSGRKMDATENLKKGVYIINGRKMVVK